MLEQMVDFFVSWFTSPSLLGIGLAVAFGALWLAVYRPPLLKRPWLWAVLAGSAILTLFAATFIQLPLQTWTGQLLGRLWSRETLMSWLLLAGLPQILLSGLVQEGAKLVPVVFWWWREDKAIDPKLGLIIGAVAGAGFGIFEAQWIHGMYFASFAFGFTWEILTTSGLEAIVPLWERFSTVAFHVAVSGLAGYGLARGWGWQSYLLAALLHSLINYSILFLQLGVLSIIQTEMIIAAWSALLAATALWLRWRSPALTGE